MARAIPPEVREQALWALELIAEGYAGTTDAGKRRLLSLLGESLDEDELRVMRAWFARHGPGKQHLGTSYAKGAGSWVTFWGHVLAAVHGAPFPNREFRGAVAWLAWGGDAAYRWVMGRDDALRLEGLVDDEYDVPALVAAARRVVQQSLDSGGGAVTPLTLLGRARATQAQWLEREEALRAQLKLRGGGEATGALVAALALPIPDVELLAVPMLAAGDDDWTRDARDAVEEEDWTAGVGAPAREESDDEDPFVRRAARVHASPRGARRIVDEAMDWD